jgi:hypothetical protein
MPKAPNSTARTERNRAMRADRARGWSYRKLARVHGVSVALAYRVASDVYMVLPNQWHRARLPKDVPQPPCPQAIALRYRLLRASY